jgi:hypothetical protein
MRQTNFLLPEKLNLILYNHGNLMMKLNLDWHLRNKFERSVPA